MFETFEWRSLRTHLSKTCFGVAMGGAARVEQGMSGCEEAETATETNIFEKRLHVNLPVFVVATDIERNLVI